MTNTITREARATRRTPSGARVSDLDGTAVTITADRNGITVRTESGDRVVIDHTPFAYIARVHVDAAANAFVSTDDPTVRYVLGGDVLPPPPTVMYVHAAVMALLTAALRSGQLDECTELFGPGHRYVRAELAAARTELERAERDRAAADARVASHQARLAELTAQLQTLTDSALDAIPNGFEGYFTSPRSSTVHLFHTGPGMGDAALCGATLDGGHRPPATNADPICKRCSHLLTETAAP